MRTPLSLVLMVMSTATCASRATSLERLTKELSDVRNAPAEALPIDRGGDVDPSILMGLSAHEVHNSLGDGRPCPILLDSQRHLRDGETSCESYDFHRVPPDSGGGGTILDVYFDRNNVCVRAQWYSTM